MTGVIQVATCLRSQVGIESRGHDFAGVFLMRTATSCSVTGTNTVSGGADLGEMGGGGAFAVERLMPAILFWKWDARSSTPRFFVRTSNGGFRMSFYYCILLHICVCIFVSTFYSSVLLHVIVCMSSSKCFCDCKTQ